MAYQDLYADADFYMSLDNNYNWSTTATLLNTSAFTGTPVFVNDSPAGLGSTHAFKVNGYGSTNATRPPRPSFNAYPQRTQTAGTFGTGKTFTCWVKFVPLVPLVDGTTNLGGTPLELWTNTPTNSSSTDDFARINFTTYQQEGGQGSDRFTQWNMGELTVSTSTSGGTSIFGTRKFAFNKWYHIAFVVKDYSPSTLEKAVYVNGQCWQYAITANKSTQGPYWCISNSPVRSDYIFTSESGNTVLDKYLAHYAKWNRALTKEEIRAQAWYGKPNEDYTSVVLGDSPTYYAPLDNADKTVDHTVYGATSWGALSDDKIGFSVNEQGPANLKAWKTTPVASSNDSFTDTTDPEMMSGLTSLFTSGEYSVEFWVKMAGKPSQNRGLLGTSTLAANNPNGVVDVQMNSTGIPKVTQSYKSTATNYLAGTVTGTSLPALTTQTELNMHPGTGVNNFADDKWHHFVYTFSKSDSWTSAGSFTGIVYVDGCRTDLRNFVNTSGWLDGTTAQSYLRLGTTLNAPSVTNGTASIAGIAFYPRRITEAEIEHHYVAGTDYVLNNRIVRYFNGTNWVDSSAQKVWNGTAWVDWTAQRYDGSAWVTI
jgi:hypothetical protein